MASPSVSNTFTNGTASSATQVNTNFTDIINALTDGTKDLSISALTCAGTATLNGNTVIGNSSADTLTITSVLSSNLALGANTTYSVGASGVGLQYLYLGGTSTFSARIGAATLSASRLYTVPEVSADASFVMTQGAQTIVGVKTFSTQVIAAGTATNDSASSGQIGEFLSQVEQAATTTATNVWKTVATITLTAGDWDVSAGIVVANSGATLTRLYAGISTSSGNDTTGMSNSVNYFELPHPTSTRDCGFGFPQSRYSVSSSTQIWLKYMGTYTISDLDCVGSIWARRVR